MNTLLLADLDTWWSGLAGAHRFFLLVGIASGVVAAFLTIGGLVGLDHGGDALDVDHGDLSGDAEGFSLRAITGFFLGLGWIGFACSISGYSNLVSSLAGLAAGLVMMFGIRFAMKSMKRLRSDGTVKYADAVGAIATVYVTIPPAGAPGGQVNVVFNNRQETLHAIHSGDTPIPGGTRVRVTAASGSTLTVEKV